MPSLRENRVSRFLTPINSMSSRGAFVVRSGLTAVHVSPRSGDRNTLLAAAYNTFASCGDWTSGVSQFHLYAGSPCGATGLMDTVSPVTRSTRTMLPSCDSLNATRYSAGSCSTTNPSPPWSVAQWWFDIPAVPRTALGPHQL